MEDVTGISAISWKLKGEDLTVKTRSGDTFEGTFDGETLEIEGMGTFSKE